MEDVVLLDALLEPLTGCLDAESAKRVADFQVAPLVQQRASALAEKANEGMLTEQEQSEYETLINATDLIAILKLKARRRLNSDSHS